MPLLIAKIKSERTLEELAQSVFQLGRQGGGDRVRRAKEALLRANPGLGRPEGFLAGSSVVVPSVPGLKLSKRVRAKDAEFAAAALDPIEESLKQIARDAPKSFETALAGAKDTLKTLGLKRFQNTIRKEAPDLEPRLPEIEENAKARVKSVRRRSSEVEKAVARAIQDVDSLRKKLG